MTTATRLYYTHGGNVDSSFIRSVYYDTTSRNLYVVYRDHDTHRVYRDVPKAVADELMSGGYYSSVGGYYNDYIKRGYTSEVFDVHDLNRRVGPSPSPVNPNPVRVSGSSVSQPPGTGSTGPWIHLDTKTGQTEEVNLNDYTIGFNVGSVAGEFNVKAESDNAALAKFTETVERLGVTYEVTELVRNFS